MVYPTDTKMPYRTLGRSGLRVSLLSFGAWLTFKGDDERYEIMKTAFEAGVNFFDNAETYNNGQAELIMGKDLQRGFKEGLWSRDELVVTTKLFFGTDRTRDVAPPFSKKHPNATGNSRKHIVEGLMASLKRLQLDYVDVVFCHRPDPITPLEETVRAMNHVIDRGMAFYWGTSEWPAEMLAEAHQIAQRLNMVGPICEQPQYHLAHRQRVEVEYARLYSTMGLGLTTWSPLASGVLTGKYSKGNVPDDSRLADPNLFWLRNTLLSEDAKKEGGFLDKVDEFCEFAKTLGASPAQVAIAWVASRQCVSTVILGASNVEQLKHNLGSLQVLDKITPEVSVKIEEIFGAPKYPYEMAIPAKVANAHDPPLPAAQASIPIHYN